MNKKERKIRLKENARYRRILFKKKGLCSICGLNKPSSPKGTKQYKTCDKCRIIRTQQTKERYHKRKNNNQCPMCLTKIEPPNVLCDRCKETRRLDWWAWRREKDLPVRRKRYATLRGAALRRMDERNEE